MDKAIADFIAINLRYIESDLPFIIKRIYEQRLFLKNLEHQKSCITNDRYNLSRNSAKQRLHYFLSLHHRFIENNKHRSIKY